MDLITTFYLFRTLSSDRVEDSAIFSTQKEKQ